MVGILWLERKCIPAEERTDERVPLSREVRVRFRNQGMYSSGEMWHGIPRAISGTAECKWNLTNHQGPFDAAKA